MTPATETATTFLSEGKMTKAKFEAVVTMLVEIVDGWNESAIDEDRGRANDSIYLVLSDDGSGTIGRGRPESDCDSAHSFDDFRELAEILGHEYGVGFADDGLEHLG